MKIFISHSSKNHDRVEILANDLKAAGYKVWLDDEQLPGSQQWWTTILENIRLCDVLMFALSPQSLASLACNRELDYALSLGKNILPIKLLQVNELLIRSELKQPQIQDYTRHNKQQFVGLIGAINKLPPSDLLPNPLPPDPQIPRSSLDLLADQVTHPPSDEDAQRILVSKLADHLGNEDTFDGARLLLERLQQHSGLYATSYRQITVLLEREAPTTPAVIIRPLKLEPRIFDSHSGPIISVCFSPSGRYILTGSEDKTIRLWNSETGEQEFEIMNDAVVRTVAFTPDEKLIIGDGSGYLASAWNVITGKIQYNFQGHSGVVFSVAVSPNGKYLATGSYDRTARLWELYNGQPVSQLPGHFDYVRYVSFSPDGNLVLTVSADEVVRVFDVENRRLIRKHNFSNAHVAVFSPIQGLIVMANHNRLEVWNLENNESKLYRLKDEYGTYDPITSIAVSPDGKYILVGLKKDLACLVDISTGNVVQEFAGHDYSVLSVAYSLDGQYVLTGSKDYTARLWKVDV